MNKVNISKHQAGSITLKRPRLSPEDVRQIDEFLATVGDYGEIRLVVQNGELRYINKLESHKAWTAAEKRFLRRERTV